MTHPADEDALDELRRLLRGANYHRERAETRLGRVAALHEQWVKAGPPPLGVPLARWWDRRLIELHNAIHPPADTTPDNPADKNEPTIPNHQVNEAEPADNQLDNPLVVQPYRNDRHEHVWAFRCWGTDTCDGWLSLDHSSKQSAERARDRHLAEDHPAEQPSRTTPNNPTTSKDNP